MWEFCYWRKYGALSIQPKIPEISVRNQMERTISVLSDRNIWDHLCPSTFDKIVVPSTALLYPSYKNNNQTRGGLGRVCATGMYRSNSEISNRNFFVEWKAPMVYNNLMMCLSSITINHWPGLVPVPRLPRPSQSVHFGDVSEALGPRDPTSTGRVTKFWRWKVLLVTFPPRRP